MLTFFSRLFISSRIFPSRPKILLTFSILILTSCWLVTLILDIQCMVAIGAILLVASYRILLPVITSLILLSSLTHTTPHSSSTFDLALNKNVSFVFTSDVLNLFDSDHSIVCYSSLAFQSTYPS